MTWEEIEQHLLRFEGGTLGTLGFACNREAPPEGEAATEPDAEERTSDFVYSTEKEGRDGHVVEQASWNLKDFRANPVVLEDHYGEVIGNSKREDIVVKPGKLASRMTGTIEWDLESPRGMVVGGQHLRRVRHGVSVRWAPVTVTARNELEQDHPAYSKGREIFDVWYGAKRTIVGNFYQNQILLEVSSAKVLGDPRALQTRSGALAPALLRGAAAIPDAGGAAATRAVLLEVLAAQADEKTRDAKLDAELGALLCRYLRADASVRLTLRAFLLAGDDEPTPAPTPTADERIARAVLDLAKTL